MTAYIESVVSLNSRWCLYPSPAQTPCSLKTQWGTMRRWWPCKCIAFGRHTINAKTISIRFHLADIFIKHLGSKWYFMNLYLLRHAHHPFWMWKEWCGKRSFVMLKWKINSEKYILGVIELSWYNKIKCTANIEAACVRKNKGKEIVTDEEREQIRNVTWSRYLCYQSINKLSVI